MSPTVGGVEVLAGSLASEKGDLLILPVRKDGLAPAAAAEAGLGALRPLCRAALAAGDFRGDLGETLLLYGTEGAFPRLLLLGVGEGSERTREKLRTIAATAARKARDLGVARAVLPLPLPGEEQAPLADLVELLTEGTFMGAYQFTEYKTVNLEKYRTLGKLVLLLPPEADEAAARRAGRRAKIRAEGVNWARDLANTPANILTPTALADRAEEMARAEGLLFRRCDRAECERMGMNAFLSVARGSEEPPWFLILEHPGAAPQGPVYALAGKGLTFDAGGISLKPPLGMQEMKYDMCGAAAVLGAMKCLHALEVPLRVVAAIPATENLPSGRATKPGDLVRAFTGKTIEILNTDAEGRLALADALGFLVQTYRPAAVLDLATLTGAVLIALGHYGAAVLANNDPLWQRIEGAAAKSGDRAWRLPLWEEFPDHIKGDTADLKNTGDANAGGGTITGATFLKEFVGDTPWAHLDIAAAAFWEKDRPVYPKGATGYGVRLLCDLLEDLAASPETFVDGRISR